MNVICGVYPGVRDWVYQQIGANPPKDNWVTIALVDQAIKAACVYLNYREHDIEMAFAAASPKWCTKRHLGIFFRYPFELLPCERVTAIVARSNKRCRKFVEGIGFKLEGVARKGMSPTEDAFLYAMLKSECRWINESNQIDSPILDRLAA